MDPGNITMEIPCEGLCGEMLSIPYKIGRQFFDNKGRPQKGLFMLCDQCYAWFENNVPPREPLTLSDSPEPH